MSPDELPPTEVLERLHAKLRAALDGEPVHPFRLAFELRQLADELDPPDEYLEHRRAWSCLIGYADLDGEVPGGADAPMRAAVEAAYLELTGQEPGFVFTGWGATLDGPHRRALEPQEAPRV